MEQLERHVIEKAILVGLHADCFSPEQTATEESLDELAALLETAGGQCVGRVLQNRHTPDPRSFIGEGKALEIRELALQTEADMIIVDNALSPSQLRVLETLTDTVVLERSALILDIFANRAQTAEGRLQVELAQYQYLLPRLSGMGKSLSRQGGGIGTRGPGETKLESDRRHIRTRILRLQRELEQVRRTRAVQRERRKKNAIPVVALVGYTNAGKSTLLNALTDAGIPANDRLFDTLDTTTRKLRISETTQVLLSDTVGFISKLPHHLVDAFQATLEELRYADILVHVIDASDPHAQAHIAVVDKLMRELAEAATPVILCYNKMDLAIDTLPHGDNCIAVSARTGEGLPQLLQLIEKNLNRGQRHAHFLLPYAMAGYLELLHQQAQVLTCAYTDTGIAVEAVCDTILYGKLRDYVVQASSEVE